MQRGKILPNFHIRYRKYNFGAIAELSIGSGLASSRNLGIAKGVAETNRTAEHIADRTEIVDETAALCQRFILERRWAGYWYWPIPGIPQTNQ